MPTLQPKVALRPDRLPQHLTRALWYVVTESTVVLIVATLSRRLVFADEAWALMLPGLVMGLLMALVCGLLGKLEFETLPKSVLTPASMLAVASATCVLLGIFVPTLSLGIVGSLIIGLLGTLVGLVVFFVFDAPEVSTHG